MATPSTPRKPGVPRMIITVSVPLPDVMDLDEAARRKGVSRSQLLRDLGMQGVRRILRAPVAA